jgi:hypothetical protein
MDIKHLYQYEQENSFYPEERASECIIKDDGFFKQIQSYFGTRHLRGTAIGIQATSAGAKDTVINSEERKLRNILQSFPIKKAIEIGTWRGVSTALLAYYAETVTTIDVRFYIDALRTWRFAGVHGKIAYMVIDDEKKEEIVGDIDFDFAFIDGDHSYEGVKKDFDLVKKCGRVLFHDYGSESEEDWQACVYSGPTKLVNSLPKDEVTICEPFALWEAK